MNQPWQASARAQLDEHAWLFHALLDEPGARTLLATGVPPAYLLEQVRDALAWLDSPESAIERSAAQRRDVVARDRDRLVQYDAALADLRRGETEKALHVLDMLIGYFARHKGLLRG